MKVTRSMRRAYDQSDAIITKAKNLKVKVKERQRRDARMMEALRAGSLPFPPHVMSWLSRQTGIASSRITPDDVAKVLAG